MSVNVVAGVWCAVALVAACRDNHSTAQSPKPVAAVEMQVTEVICREDVGGFAHLGGLVACESALDRFLAEHPRDGIVSVIPIEATAPPSPDVRHTAHPGTQRLVVVHHAGDGPGLRADNISIIPYVCSPSIGSRLVGPAYCQDAVRKSVADFEFNHPTIWVPLTGEAYMEGVEAGTQRALVLGPREITRPPQADH